MLADRLEHHGEQAELLVDDVDVAHIGYDVDATGLVPAVMVQVGCSGGVVLEGEYCCIAPVSWSMKDKISSRTISRMRCSVYGSIGVVLAGWSPLKRYRRAGAPCAELVVVI